MKDKYPIVIEFNETIRTREGNVPPLEEYLPRAVGKALGMSVSSFAGFFDYLPEPHGLSESEVESLVEDIRVSSSEAYLRLMAQDAANPARASQFE